ncbi:addiction module antidote protein [Marinomonas transparens]|uniref:Addiction module antidote protein n=1 Tax=Marinomonas transparens TaxID=2795388 RepID=A0A934JRT6_9GAMM|nr:addiction module antidote protein [Marinomonas transparens]MBJ7538683.1 putative addiction module antidote protein [Marinomonas transparens]
MTNTTAFDVASYLETDEDIRDFLSAAAEDGSAEHLLHSLGIAAKAKGMTQVANEAGVTRASLYKSLSENANPKLETITKLLGVFGCKLQVTSIEER